jgi:small subunit ribosomal protein S20
MPVTKTAKRALKASKRKAKVNSVLRTKMLAAIRVARRDKKKGDVIKAVSLTDRAAKTNLIHKNKAARIKSTLSKLLPVSKSPTALKKTVKKASKKK